MFKDREEAGLVLAKELQQYKGKEAVVLAIPRGGLPLGSIIAKDLQLPLDVALTKKIGHPYNKEYAIGAANLESHILNDITGVSISYIEEEIMRIRAVLKERYDQYYKNSKPQNLGGKTVIIVDDGIATGNTMLATIALVHHKKPDKIVIAIPVASPRTIEKLEGIAHVDEVICLFTPIHFRAVGQFYDNFFPVTDQEAITILEKSNKGLTFNNSQRF